MEQLSRPRLIMKRLADDWMLLASVFIGFIIATTLAAATPVYLKSLEQLAFSASLDRWSGRFLNIHIFGSHVALTQSSIGEAERSLFDAVDGSISEAHAGRERYLRTGAYLVGLPSRPLPEPGATRILVSRGFFQHLTNLEHHSRFVEGRMARSAAAGGPTGSDVEAVIATATAEKLHLNVDDVVFLTQSIGNPTTLTARIVGILEAANPDEEYWSSAGIFLDPASLTEAPQVGVQVRLREAPVALFVTEEGIVDVVGRANVGTLVKPVWFVTLDKEALREWSFADTRLRFKRLDDAITRAMPGASVAAGIVHRVISDIESRGVFSRVPMLLLLAVMVVTVLFFLSMMVSYLVQSRERDAALLRTRGVGTLQVLRLYALEGLVMTALAVVLAPFLAIAMVALAGKLPSFSGMTGGGFLPVEIGVAPFLMAAGAGLLCLVIFVVPGVLGARSGLLAHKLRSSRPPTLPFFHRYYLDVALLVLGGLTFWELSSRGQFISGGLFNEVEINETLLIAPVLFLIVVALVFIRFFPLVVRYLSGESPAVVHLGVVATVLVLGAGVALRETREGNVAGWVGPVALLVSFAVLYWATQRSRGVALRVGGGLVLQGVLVGGFVIMERPVLGDALFAPAIVLIMLVPAQVLFLLLVALTRRSPVWLSMGMWHMSRNPLQYTWLVLLLVLVTGVGILSTTVGGTLERSQRQRVQYDIAADIRVSGVSRFLDGGIQGVKDSYLSTPGIAAGALALRTSGSVGHANVQVLAVESGEFRSITWYRDDFSASSLADIMSALQPDGRVERLEIPAGATSIGIWVKPETPFGFLSVWMVLRDSAGEMTTLTLGDVVPREWQLMKADVPPSLRPPLSLVSVQVFEPGQGNVLTAGTILIDDIHVLLGPSNEEVVLEDFEGPINWMPIPTSLFRSDTISSTSLDPHRGERAAAFKFGISTNKSVRGFYRTTGVRAVPVVASTSLLKATGKELGDSFISKIAGRMTHVVIRDTVDFFPTMSPYGGGFFLADLDSVLGYVNIMGQPSRVVPNELFVKKTPNAGPAVDELAQELSARFISVEDVDSRLDTVRLDTLATTGWRAMVFLSLGIVLLATALGYVSYLLLYVNRSRREVGFMQSMGLSRLQLMSLLGFEHLTIAAIGLGLGTWAGFRMSALIVSQLAVTETGQRVVPAFILKMEWNLMAPTYAAMVGVFIGAQFVLNRIVGRADLTAISRVSD